MPVQHALKHTCVLVLCRYCKEIGLHLDTVPVDLSSGAHKEEWFREVCHSAVLPALQAGLCRLAQDYNCLHQTLCCFPVTF